MINFNKKTAIENIKDVFNSEKFSGGFYRKYTEKCNKWFEDNLHCKKSLLTNSCTSAIELAAILLDLKPNDEIIMPSFSFVSIANVFLVHRCKIVFVDIDPDTLCIDLNEVRKKITKKTKAIVPIHYAGISCDMDELMKIAKENDIYVIEDAAQALLAEYKGRSLGTIGDFGAISFHDTKNVTCGEGGVLLINNEKFIEKADIAWSCGTNKKEYLNNQVDTYSWTDIGLSFTPSEITAAFLYSSLLETEGLTKYRIRQWNSLYKRYEVYYEVPKIPKYSKHNAHIFYILVDVNRNKIMKSFIRSGVNCSPHFVPLHSSPYGRMICKDKLPVTEEISKRLLRIHIL